MKMRFLILLLLISQKAIAQKMPSDYFAEAASALESKKYDLALGEYKQLLEKYPKSELYSRAYYNVGYVYFLEKKYDKAITIFEKILGSNFNELEPLNGDIMADPYANYKHRSSELLSDIYCAEKDYPKALHYFTLATTTYPYLHFCGNEYAANDIHIAIRYADIYQHLRQPDKAIASLLPVVFSTLADNSAVLGKLKPLLAAKKQVKEELSKSLKKVYIAEEQVDGRTYKKYYFKLLGTEVPVPESYDSGLTDSTETEAVIKQTAFYKMLAQL